MIDTLIIGAGPSGLCAAKTLLEHDPSANVVLVDARTTPGGVWSREQLYPTLKTNNLWGSIDFTDFPMEQARFGIGPGQHVTGEAMHAYLAAYAEHFGLTRRIRFRTRVLSVCRGEEGKGWAVTVRHDDDNDKETHVLNCRRLVVATGVTNVPHLPVLRGVEAFNAPHLHSADLGRSADALFGSPAVQTVAVLGGSKSAYDAVYLAASTGHKVEWIIRRSGRGPVWVFPTHTFMGPIKALRERLVTRRFFSLMSPCVWPDYSGFGWLRRFLHGSKLGKAIAQTFWSAIHADTIRDCGYKEDSRIGVLEPEQNPFWYGTSSGTLNYEQDIFSFVKSGQVQIHREDLSHLSEHTIHLASGTQLSVDALITSTGFSAKPAVSFQPTTMHADLGVPSAEYTDFQKAQWAERDDRADLTIAAQFPRLVHGPFTGPASSDKQPYNPGMAAEVAYTPWRLYRGMAPPGLAEKGDRSLVFLGMFSNIANTIRLEIQCLWALAYFEGKLPSLDGEGARGRIMEETALFQRYTRHRAPYGHGTFYPDLVFDQVPYWDTLLQDLGLPTRRKANAFRELFEPYSQDDYRGLVKQWLAENSK